MKRPIFSVYLGLLINIAFGQQIDVYVNINDCSLCNSSIRILSQPEYINHVRFISNENEKSVFPRYLDKYGFSTPLNHETIYLNDSSFSKHSETYSICRLTDKMGINVISIKLSDLSEYLPLINFLFHDTSVYPFKSSESTFSNRAALHPLANGWLVSDYFLSESFILNHVNDSIESSPIAVSRNLLNDYYDQFDSSAFEHLYGSDSSDFLSVYLTGIFESNNILYGLTDHTYPGSGEYQGRNRRSPAFSTIDSHGIIQSLIPWNFRCDSTEYTFSHFHGFNVHNGTLIVPSVRKSAQTSWNKILGAFELVNGEYVFDHFIELPIADKYSTLINQGPILPCGFSRNVFFFRDLPLLYCLTDSSIFDFHNALLQTLDYGKNSELDIWIQDVLSISDSHYLIYGKFNNSWRILLYNADDNKFEYTTIYYTEMSDPNNLAFGINGLLYALISDNIPSILAKGL